VIPIAISKPEEYLIKHKTLKSCTLRKRGCRTMHKLRRINIENSQNLLERVKEFAHKLRDTLPVKEVYLYGSVARSEIHEGSDIDLIVVGDFKERIFDRIGKILDLTDLPIEPLVYTEEEWSALRSEDNPFVNKILKEAIRLT